MARVELSDCWYVGDDLDTLRAKLIIFFAKRKMKIVSEEGGAVHAMQVKQGTQLGTRLIGGWFVSPIWLPKKATVSYSSTRKGIRLRVSIEESLGFGILDPLLEKKYRNYFREWMNDLEDALEPAGQDESAEAESVEAVEDIQDHPPDDGRVTR